LKIVYARFFNFKILIIECLYLTDSITELLNSPKVI